MSLLSIQFQKTMKMFPLIAPLCFALLFAAASAQGPSPDQIQQQIEREIQSMASPERRLRVEAEGLTSFYSTWNGQGTWLPLRVMIRTGGEAELGLSDEQKQKLSFLYKENEMGVEFLRKMHQEQAPELMRVIEMQQAARIPDDPNFERATEEQKNAYREADMAMNTLALSAMQEAIVDTLTPEQMLQVRKLEMQLMSAMGIPFPSMFEPLGLTEEQKNEMEKITDAMKAEFEPLVLEAATLKADRIVAVYGSLKGKSFASYDEYQKANDESFRQYVSSESFRKKNLDVQERGVKLVTLLQNRLMNVLTDAQLDKMQKILDEAPMFAKQMLAQSNARQEEQKKSQTYTPGPDKWQLDSTKQGN
jgi:hypothetical protein